MEPPSDVRRGYLLLADISGYTAFLARSELDHAQDALRSLFEALMASLPAPLRVVEVEGDALFAYAPDGPPRSGGEAGLPGQTLVEVVENAYAAFAQAQERMHRNTTCTCTACRLIPELDLKFVVHHGPFMLQQLVRRHAPKPSGPEVILAHRLLKNAVREATGVRAYAFLTEAAVRAGGLGALAEGLTPHAEAYEHVGEVRGFVHDLGAVWQRERERRRVVVSPEETWLCVQGVLPAPPPVAWAFLNEPEHKAVWLAADAVTATGGPRGRTGLGTTHHCAHGRTTIVQEIVDWRPFDYVTAEQAWPVGARVVVMDRLEPHGVGTRLRRYVGVPRGRSALHERLVVRPAYAMMRRQIEADLQENVERLRRYIGGRYTAGDAAGAAAPS